MTFLDQINLFHPSIKFTAETSTQQVSFLDATVILEGNNIHTDSIPYSQALRCRRICSREEDFKKRTKELRTHLLDRGYQTTTVDAQIQKASCKAASHGGPESQFTQTTNQTNTFSSHIPSRTHQ